MSSSSTECTAYLSNLPFSWTNNDIAKLVEPFGTVARVTVVKHKQDRSRSKGVAFVHFSTKESAERCILELNLTQVGGRRIKVENAKDNGRASEFNKKRTYSDLSKCFECGEPGHISYACPRNQLGVRIKPKNPKKQRKLQPSDNSHQDVRDSTSFRQQRQMPLPQVSSERPLRSDEMVIRSATESVTIPLQQTAVVEDPDKYDFEKRIAARRPRKEIARGYFSDED